MAPPLWHIIPLLRPSNLRALPQPFRPVSRAPLGPCRGRGDERIVGPMMARIAALHLGLDRGVAAAPEAGKIARDLHRPMSRRQQLDDERDAPCGNGGMAVEAEQLLHAN